MSKESRTHIKGPIWNILGGGMYAANSVLLLMLVSRRFGVEASGEFSIAFTVSQTLWIIGVFGASHMMMTDYRQEYRFSTYLGLKILSTSAMFPMAVAICLILGFDSEKFTLTLLLTLYMAAHAFSELFQSRMFQSNRLDLAGKSQFFRTVFSLVLFTAAIYIFESNIVACAVLALSNLAAIYYFSYRPCRTFILTEQKPGREQLAKLTKACLPVFVSILTMNLLMQMPKFVIEFLGNNEMQGLFGMIFMPAYAINLLSNFAYQPMLKNLGEYIYSKDRQNLLLLFSRLVIVTLAAAFLCSLLTWMIGAPVLSWLYGVELLDYRWDLTMVVLGGGIYALCQLMYFVFVLMRRQKDIMFSYIISLIVSVPVSIYFISILGLYGAIISFVITHGFLLMVFSACFYQKLRRMKNV